jgi:hypothetical protein
MIAIQLKREFAGDSAEGFIEGPCENPPIRFDPVYVYLIAMFRRNAKTLVRQGLV